jgi:hypothetical protein
MIAYRPDNLTASKHSRASSSAGAFERSSWHDHRPEVSNNYRWDEFIER